MPPIFTLDLVHSMWIKLCLLPGDAKHRHPISGVLQLNHDGANIVPIEIEINEKSVGSNAASMNNLEAMESMPAEAGRG